MNKKTLDKLKKMVYNKTVKNKRKEEFKMKKTIITLISVLVLFAGYAHIVSAERYNGGVCPKCQHRLVFDHKMDGFVTTHYYYTDVRGHMVEVYKQFED